MDYYLTKTGMVNIGMTHSELFWVYYNDYVPPHDKVLFISFFDKLVKNENILFLHPSYALNTVQAYVRDNMVSTAPIDVICDAASYFKSEGYGLLVKGVTAVDDILLVSYHPVDISLLTSAMRMKIIDELLPTL